MSRLTIVMNGKAYCNNPNCQGDCIKCYRFSTILQNLAHYEDLEEQGRLITLPCAVGEPIFEVQKGSIVQHSLSRNWRIVRYLDEGIFGEIAFTTKEEAEAKLAELGGKA